MQVTRLIKGGTVVDGTGAPAYRADVRVRDGRISEIAPTLEPEGREHIIDATGCYVTPGFIDLHNHWDVGIWWTPTVDPSPAYGITTSINGNCAFSAAPLSDDPRSREDLIEIFNFFEDIPEAAMRELVPWNWRKWSEMRAALKAKVRLPLNFASYCGHIALRIAAMGQDAWARNATPAELEVMASLLDDALAAGALGLSTNQMDLDRTGRPVPSKLADTAEWTTLLDVMARYPGCSLQLMADMVQKMEAPEQIDHIGTLAGDRRVKVQYVGIVYKFQAHMRDRIMALHERFKASGMPLYQVFHWVSATPVINFEQTLEFTRDHIWAWHEWVMSGLSNEEKLAKLDDPEWRAAARESWDNQAPHSELNYPERVTLHESETAIGPVGITLADYMQQSGIAHPSDALAEWILINGILSIAIRQPAELDEETMLQLARDPQALGNLSDSGAHGKVFCGVGHNVMLLTNFVRDTGKLSIEEAVNILTWRTANFLGLEDRGRIEIGKRADIVVFDLNEIEVRPEEKVWDVPDGTGGRTYRFVRPPAPMRLTLVNGEATFLNGAFTGKFPGEYIGPDHGQSRTLAEAAE